MTDAGYLVLNGEHTAQHLHCECCAVYYLEVKKKKECRKRLCIKNGLSDEAFFKKGKKLDRKRLTKPDIPDKISVLSTKMGRKPWILPEESQRSV